MKIKEDLILREIAGEYVVISAGSGSLDFNRMLVLNESGALMFRLLQRGVSEQELVDRLLQEYAVDADTAQRDVGIFLDRIRCSGCVEEA